nr:MAG TPA: hypothetical protein [Bacteriophage sp.]
MVNTSVLLIRYAISRPRCRKVDDRMKFPNIKHRSFLLVNYLYVNMYNRSCVSITTYRIRRYE